MKTINERINEARFSGSTSSWEVWQGINSNYHCGNFKAPDKPFLYVNATANVMSFCTYEEIESNFDDFDMVDDAKEIKKLDVGESWSADGENIYIRLR